MKIKIDENLPNECAAILNGSGFEADTVADEGMTGADDSELAARARTERRVLLTLDLDFANIRAYRPADYPGIIVIRPKLQDKHTVLALVLRIALALGTRSPEGELWIVGPDRIRFRT